MEVILKIGALMAIVYIANISPVTTQNYNQGTFSSGPDDRISISYSSSSSDSSGSNLFANGYGTADKCTHSGKFILAGSSSDNSGQTRSVCIEGTLSLEDKSWSVNGRSGNKSLTGNGKYKLDTYSSPSSIYGSFDVPKEAVTVSDSGYQMPAVCGQLMSMDTYNTGSQEFSYNWNGATQWDDDSTVTWSVSGSKSSTSETHTISGSISSTNYNNMYQNSPSGCLTSLKIDNISDYFTGSGHINGRGLQVSGRLHSGMYIADMVSLSPDMGMPAFTGSFYFYPGSGSFSSSSSSGYVSGTVFENGTWTTMMPGNHPEGDYFTGTYSLGMFQGTGKISYMDATISGQYGASCWFTDSVMVTCPTISPNTTNSFDFYNGTFYVCGSITPGTVNKTQLMASGWMFIAKNESEPMKLTAESFTVSGELATNNMMSTSEEQTVVLSITDSTGAPSSLSLKGYLSTYNGQISGSLSNDKVSISIMNGKSLGGNVVVTGSVMNM